MRVSTNLKTYWTKDPMRHEFAIRQLNTGLDPERQVKSAWKLNCCDCFNIISARECKKKSYLCDQFMESVWDLLLYFESLKSWTHNYQMWTTRDLLEDHRRSVHSSQFTQFLPVFSTLIIALESNQFSTGSFSGKRQFYSPKRVHSENHLFGIYHVFFLFLYRIVRMYLTWFT